MSKRATDGDEQYLRGCCWAGRRAIWLTSRGWGDYAHTCYIIIVVEAVFVQVTRFLLNSIRAGSSFISGLSDGISWPLPETTLTARLTKKKDNYSSSERWMNTQPHKGWYIRESTGAGGRLLGPLANMNNPITTRFHHLWNQGARWVSDVPSSCKMLKGLCVRHSAINTHTWSY